MMDMHDDDQELKDKLLQSLIEKMEDILGDGMDPKKGMAVEVAAPDKEHLADGLDKAKEVIDHAPVGAAIDKMEPEAPMAEEAGDDRSDAERLAELLGDEDDEDDDKKC